MKPVGARPVEGSEKCGNRHFDPLDRPREPFHTIMQIPRNPASSIFSTIPRVRHISVNAWNQKGRQ